MTTPEMEMRILYGQKLVNKPKTKQNPPLHSYAVQKGVFMYYEGNRPELAITGSFSQNPMLSSV